MTVTIPIKIDDFANYGATGSIILGYCRLNPRQTAKQMSRRLRISEEALRNHLQSLERIGVVERVYYAKGVGRPKLIGVNVL